MPGVLVRVQRPDGRKVIVYEGLNHIIESEPGDKTLDWMTACGLFFSSVKLSGGKATCLSCLANADTRLVATTPSD